jgi:arylsulfatase A-like enzyme
MNAICLMLDRLHVGHLGAYGNTWIQTPALDRLASESIVFDQALIDCPRLEMLYRSYWQGWHAMLLREPPAERPSLPAMLRDAGVTTTLLTDEQLVSRHAMAVDFDELVEIDPPWQAEGAREIEQTHFARCMVQVIDFLQSAHPPFMLWCHLGGLATAWDAPLEFRQMYWEEGDPPPPDSAEVPDRMLSQDYDPDELLGISQAYAGQVSLLDTCLGALVEFLRTSPAGKETLLAITSARGFPLGEHGRVGPCDEALYSELAHVPLMLRFPDLHGATARSQALVEPSDLWATLLDWWGIAQRPPSPTGASLLPIINGQHESPRDRLCIVGQDAQRAIRTPAWHLRSALEGELFAKPDDRWDVNNVAIRCREVVECLTDALDQYQQTIQSGFAADLPPLSDVLVSGLE